MSLQAAIVHLSVCLLAPRRVSRGSLRMQAADTDTCIRLCCAAAIAVAAALAAANGRPRYGVVTSKDGSALAE